MDFTFFFLFHQSARYFSTARGPADFRIATISPAAPVAGRHRDRHHRFYRLFLRAAFRTSARVIWLPS